MYPCGKSRSEVAKEHGFGLWMRGRKATNETIAKRVASRAGYKHSNETKEKIRASNSGRPLSEEHRKKLSEAAKRRVRTPFSNETRAKISAALRGKSKSPEHVCAMSESKKAGYAEGRYTSHFATLHQTQPGWNSGANNGRWVEDRTKALDKHLQRSSPQWKEWRSSVFARDNFTCRECGARGCYIEAHHIIPARSCGNELLFELKNGISLCRPCHVKTMGKEDSFEQIYSSMTGLMGDRLRQPS